MIYLGVDLLNGFMRLQAGTETADIIKQWKKRFKGSMRLQLLVDLGDDRRGYS